jgi:hypothetical protein
MNSHQDHLTEPTGTPESRAEVVVVSGLTGEGAQYNGTFSLRQATPESATKTLSDVDLSPEAVRAHVKKFGYSA